MNKLEDVIKLLFKTSEILMTSQKMNDAEKWICHGWDDSIHGLILEISDYCEICKKSEVLK